MLGSLLGRAFMAAARGAATIVVNVAVAELRKPETQQKIGRTVATAAQSLQEPANNAARVLGRATGTLRNKLGR